MTTSHLLPPNASQLEQLAAEALAQIERVPVPIRDLANPDRCPVELLPYLAWAFSVDRWDSSWSEATKRAVIKASYFVHARKGTIGALRRLVEPLGYLFQITEWWQQQPEGIPGTFAIDIGIRDTAITDETFGYLERLIDDAKPVSRHLTELSLTLEVPGRLYVAAAAQDGETLTVYPYAPGTIEVTSSALLFAGAEHSIDTLSVYP